MSKYAIVIAADPGLLPGVHGMLNALKYYGDFDSGELEFHLLHLPNKPMDKFISMVKESGHFPSFKAINIMDIKAPYDADKHKIYFLKFYRSFWTGELAESYFATKYDAIAYFDADRMITASIMPYMRYAANHDCICMCHYAYDKRKDYNGSYKRQPLLKNNKCPYDPAATFFVPSTHGKYFAKAHRLITELDTGREMGVINYILITDDLVSQVVALPMDTWNLRKIHSRIMDWNMGIDGKYGLTFKSQLNDLKPRPAKLYPLETIRNPLIEAETGSNETDIITTHRRWHYRGWLEKRSVKADAMKVKFWGRATNHNLNQIWSSYAFFNFGCYTRIDWDKKWALPYEYIDIDTGLLKKTDIPIWEMETVKGLPHEDAK